MLIRVVLLCGLVLLSAQGCSHKRAAVQNPTSSEREQWEVRLSWNPCGYTGCLKVQALRPRSTWDRFGTAISNLGKTALALGAGILTGPFAVFTIAAVSDKFPQGSSADKWAPLPDETIVFKIHETGQTFTQKTDANGEAEYHLLEAVVETEGRSDITLTCGLPGGSQQTYVLPRTEARGMYRKYRWASTRNWRDVAAVAKDVIDAAVFLKWSYDNYRLVRTGKTLFQAFRLTSPAFIAGIVIEEIVWRLVVME